MFPSRSSLVRHSTTCLGHDAQLVQYTPVPRQTTMCRVPRVSQPGGLRSASGGESALTFAKPRLYVKNPTAAFRTASHRGPERSVPAIDQGRIIRHSACMPHDGSAPSGRCGASLDLLIRQRYAYSWQRISSVESVCVITLISTRYATLFQFSRTLRSNIAQSTVVKQRPATNITMSKAYVNLLNTYFDACSHTPTLILVYSKFCCSAESISS